MHTASKLTGVSWGTLGPLGSLKGCQKRKGKKEKKKKKGKKKGKKAPKRKKSLIWVSPHTKNHGSAAAVQSVSRAPGNKLHGRQIDRGWGVGDILQLSSGAPRLMTHWAPWVGDLLDTPLKLES